MSLRLHWVRPVQDLIKGIGFGYSASSANLGRAVERAGAELVEDGEIAVHFDYPMSFQPIEGRRNLLFCLAPGTRVLTADLRWVGVESLQLGDELIAPDEELGPQNRMRRSTVLGTSRLRAPRYRIVTDRGEVIASAAHQWVAMRRSKEQRRWMRSDQLRPGDRISFYCDPWASGTTYEDGWLGGLLDGEGFLSRHAGAMLGLAQNQGPVLDRAVALLRRDGFKLDIRPHTNRRLQTVLIQGDMLRALGRYRPLRLLEKSHLVWEGRRSWHKGTGRATVLAVEPIGEGEVCGLATSTKTVIAEGMLSHNTMFETRPLPPAFFPYLERADAVFVPSRFCYDLFRPHVPKRIPVRVSPLGYDPAVFYPPLRRREFPDVDAWQPGQPRFRYFWNGSASQRKGWMQTTGAWSWVFKGLPWCEILFKTTDENGAGAVTQVSQNTRIDTRTLPWHELAELYRQAHCFVLPSLGEGWGLTPLEAMACGCPTIVCKFGGVLEYANAQTAFFAPYDFQTDDTPLGPAEGSYTTPAKLSKVMYQVASNYPAAVERGEYAARFVRERFTWPKVAQRFIENLETIGWGRA